MAGDAVAPLVEVLRYKSECCGFDSRWCQWNFSLTSFRPHYGARINNNNNNNIYLLQMGCHPVAVITLHVFPNTANKFT
jgi:hypothetical protein